MLRVMTAMLVAAMLIPAATAQEAQAVRDAEAKLGLKIDVEFKDMTIPQMAEYLAEISGLNIFVDQAVRNSDDKVNLKVNNVTIRSILNLSLGKQKLGWGWKDGVLRIAPVEEFQKDVKLEIFDVRDILYPIIDFPGVEVGLGDGGMVPVGGDSSTTPAEFPLVDLIKAHTGGKTWDDNPKASINLNNGLLVVKQTREVIKQIHRVIGDLRSHK